MGISITGMVSGLDTAQMVSDLMDIERIPYKNLATKKTNLQSEQTIFRNINTAFRSLETALNNLRLDADWRKLAGSSSNAGVVGISTNNPEAAGKYQVNVVQLAQKNTVQFKTEHLYDGDNLKAAKIQVGELEINADEIKGDNIQEKLESIAALINKSSSTAGATASVVNVAATGEDYRLVITSDKTGDDNKVKFNLGSNDITQAEGINNNAITRDDNNNIIAKNLNAIVQIDGVEVQRSTNSITDLIKGTTLTLTGKGSSTVTVELDTNSIVKNVQEFVKAYNNLIGLVKDNLAKPADEDKMNPLQGDTLLKRIDNELYNIFNSGVKNTGDTKASFMEQLGLSIDQGVTSASLMTGKITFDEAAFKTALAENPDRVIGVFTNGKPKNPGTDTYSAGVITQLSGIINEYASSASGLISNKITGYDSEIKFVDERMERMSMRLDMYEVRLKQQFTTMETMLSSLQNEQKWLTQQFDSLLKSNSK